MDFRHAAVIAGDEAVEDLREPHPRPPVDPAHDAEIDRDDVAIGGDEQIALMHVGMEEAFGDRLAQEGVDQPCRDLLHIMAGGDQRVPVGRSEEHTSELQSLMRISYAVFCLKKKKKKRHTNKT